MTTQEFLDWVHSYYKTKNKIHTLQLASNFLGLGRMTLYYRMKRGTILDEAKEAAMLRIVANPPPPDFVAPNAFPKRSKRGNQISEEVRRCRLQELKTFFDYVQSIYSYKTNYDTISKVSELLGVHYLTAYSWYRGVSTPLKKYLLKAKEIMNGPDKLGQEDKITLPEFLDWLIQKYGCTKKSHAIEKAASLFHVCPATIHYWLRKETPLKRSVREEMAEIMAGTVLNKANHKVVIYMSPDEAGLTYAEFLANDKAIKARVEELLMKKQQVTLIPFDRQEYDSFLEKRGIPDTWESRREWGKQY